MIFHLCWMKKSWLLRMLDVEGVVLRQEGGVLQQPGARLGHLHLLDDALRRCLWPDGLDVRSDSFDEPLQEQHSVKTNTANWSQAKQKQVSTNTGPRSAAWFLTFFSSGIIFSRKFLLKRKWTKWWTTTTRTQVIPWSLANGRSQKFRITYARQWS